MHKLLIVIASLFLVSCSLPGTQTESSSTDSTFIYDGSGFTISLPNNWTTVKSTDIPTPYRGALVAAYISPEVKYGFSSNIIVMKDSLNTPVTSKKYSELNYVQTTKNYLEYTKLQDSTITFPDSDESQVYVFEARYNTTTPLMKFIQTAKVCGTDVYLLHFTLSLDKDATRYVDLLKTFECK